MSTAPTAALMLRHTPVYRRDLFRQGLQTAGFTVIDQPRQQPTPADVLVLWNRMRGFEHQARVYEQRKATVLIAENGYIGTNNKGERPLALAKSLHNGCGSWRVGGPERVGLMNLELAPWRQKGDFILVLPQRGIGSQGVAMPAPWVRSICARLERLTLRPVRVRPHPGNTASDPGRDLNGAHAVVTWGSGAAIKAIAAGYPVFYELQNWIGGPAGVFLDKRAKIESPFLGDRAPMFARLAWAQWWGEEIQNGTAFQWLLG